MSINLIIATYGGKINKFNFNSHKDKYLKCNLKVLNDLNLDVSQITIMKPKVNKEHKEIENYYDFSNLNLSNIMEKIKIIECENIGISYGQLFNALNCNLNFDYHIFIEDDYLFFNKASLKNLLNKFNKCEKDALLCSFIYNKKWNLLKHSKSLKENNCVLNEIKLKFKQLKIDINTEYNIPDFSLCIMSKYTVDKIFNRFTHQEIYTLFSIPFNSLWLHQILFGLILFESDVKIYDIQEEYINIFYNTIHNSISLTNNNKNINMSEIQKLKGNLNDPIFVPLDIFFFNKFINDVKKISNLNGVSINFLKYYDELKNILIY